MWWCASWRSYERRNEENTDIVAKVSDVRAMGGGATMSAGLEHIATDNLGERLRIARDAAKLTQAEAAASAGLARTTLVAIEHGQRRVRMEELRTLARLYGTTVNGLSRRDAIHLDLAPQFRKLGGAVDPVIEDATRLLADLVSAEVELENLLGIQRTRNDPPRRPILPGDVTIQAEQDATELRQWLGIGAGPVLDIVSLLELRIGARVFVRQFDGKISGAFAFDDAVGACILINGNHRPERRAHTAAHELGHFVSTRDKPEVLRDGPPDQARSERYANAFASAFLTPARTTMQLFQDITAGSSHLSRRHVILLAHMFGVSREALVRRLEALKLARPGTWDWFQDHGGITDVQARQVLGDAAGQDSVPPVSQRLNLLAAEVWRRELLSEGQLARLLRMDRVALRAMLDDLEPAGDEAADALRLRG